MSPAVRWMWRSSRLDYGCRQWSVRGNDDEVNAVFIEGSVDGVSGVEDGEEVPQDGDIGRIGVAWRVVVICEGLEEIFP